MQAVKENSMYVNVGVCGMSSPQIAPGIVLFSKKKTHQLFVEDIDFQVYVM